MPLPVSGHPAHKEHHQCDDRHETTELALMIGAIIFFALLPGAIAVIVIGAVIAANSANKE